MKSYRLASKRFSREWRRSKAYTFPELRWLARRRGLDIRKHKDRIHITGPKTDVEFVELAEAVFPVRPNREATAVKALATLALPAPKV